MGRATPAGLAAGLLVVTCTQSPPETLPGLLPAMAAGYQPLGADAVYTADNLFDLIDGGAEVYRALNVQRVVSRRYGKAGAPEIIVDLFDMGSARDAYGAFHVDTREGAKAGIGRDSERMGGSLYFWKDRYFVSIVSLGEATEATRGTEAIGRAMAASITRDGEPPALLARLPPGGLLASQIVYFHDAVHLSTRYDLGEGNPLGLDRQTEGVLARYGRDADGGSGLVLMLVRYPTAGAAERARSRLARMRLLGNAKSLREKRDALSERPDGTWEGTRRLGHDLVVVLEAESRPRVEEMFARVARIQEETHATGP